MSLDTEKIQWSLGVLPVISHFYLLLVFSYTVFIAYIFKTYFLQLYLILGFPRLRPLFIYTSNVQRKSDKEISQFLTHSMCALCQKSLCLGVASRPLRALGVHWPLITMRSPREYKLHSWENIKSPSLSQYS